MSAAERPEQEAFGGIRLSPQLFDAKTINEPHRDSGGLTRLNPGSTYVILTISASIYRID